MKNGKILLFCALGLFMAAKKKNSTVGSSTIDPAWTKAVKPLIDEYTKDTDLLFAEFENEPVKNNCIWRAKYKERFDQLEKEHNKKYAKLWYAFHGIEPK